MACDCCCWLVWVWAGCCWLTWFWLDCSEFNSSLSLEVWLLLEACSLLTLELFVLFLFSLLESEEFFELFFELFFSFSLFSLLCFFSWWVECFSSWLSLPHAANNIADAVKIGSTFFIFHSALYKDDYVSYLIVSFNIDYTIEQMV